MHFFFFFDEAVENTIQYGWQEAHNGKRIYLAKDNSSIEDINAYLLDNDQDNVFLNYTDGNINLGLHEYNGSLYTSNLVGVCRLKGRNGETLFDSDGNELILKVVPRFNIKIIDLLNYIKDDDEFDRYMAPQTVSNRHREKDIKALNQNEIFYFYDNEKPLEVEDDISSENSIITTTVFLSLLRLLCRKPLMGRMEQKDNNLVGKVKGKIIIEKNIRLNSMHGRNDRFACRYLHYTDDIKENQILKAALIKAKRFLTGYFGVNSKDNNYYSSIISYCSHALRNISTINYSGNDCNGLRFTGCYTYYKPVIQMAKMVLDDISIEPSGATKVSGFIIPYAISMEKLFEVYVRAYLKKNGVNSYKSSTMPGLYLEKFDKKIDVFKEEEKDNPGNYISGSIKPDIIIIDQETGEHVVLDVKYKDYKHGGNRSDRLQLLAYSMMLDANDIGIVFPADEENTIFDSRTINSRAMTLIRYHQLLLSMNKNDSSIANYVKTIFDKKRETSD